MTLKHFSLGSLEIDPVGYASQGNAILGIRDSGKTYTATFLAEQLLEAGIPFVVFDPIGVWRFLKIPGTGRGYPVVVAGGKSPDLDLTPATAPAIVEAAMQSGISLVIDLFSIELSKSQWRQIVKDSVRLLLHRNQPHGLRHVFIEEAAEFIPQKPTDWDVYAEVEKLARMGGNSRLGYTLINQRSQEVSKAILELCENVFLHRQRGKNSIENMDKWLSIAGAAEQKEIIRTLPSLPQGECFAWIGGDNPTPPTRVRVPVKNSLHPDRRVMRGDDVETVQREVDVAKFVTMIREALPAIAAEAKDNDPKALRAEIARLKKGGDDQVSATQVKAAYERGYLAGFEEGHQQCLSDVKVLGQGWLDSLRFPAPKRSAVYLPEAVVAPVSQPVHIDLHAELPPVARERSAPRSDAGPLNSAARKMLEVIDTTPPIRRSWTQIATLAGLRARGGHFNTGKRALIDSGLIREDGGLVSIVSPTGRAPIDTSPAAMVEMWAGQLSGAAPKILRHLFNHGPAPRQAVAKALGMQPSGGHWNTSWKELRDNDIVRLQGDVAHLTELFHK